ncbi:MAG: phenylalanine--tRNA ligase subunit beta [Candidatus Omnitrophota bacterium]|jgi:phenylalanyl-tRNA synthetase beta chain
MKFSYNWLKDFVDIKADAEALAQKLTMAGHEVGSVEPLDGDFILEAEITSNRADCFCMSGMAREAAAVLGGKFKAPAGFFKDMPKISKVSAGFSVSLDSAVDCPLYTATLIKGVKVGPSPEWLRRRLESIGCRSINNLVDITNYALFEWGAPLHAFDLDKLSGGRVNVRRARQGETLVTIDGKKNILTPEILVIADAGRPVAAAGIMGGAESEVSGSTVNVLLEGAIFDPVLVRKGRQLMAAQTEASYRFERGVDAERVRASVERALMLILSICGGSAEVRVQKGAKIPRRKQVRFSLSRAETLLNIKLPRKLASKILSGLGFTVGKSASDPDILTVEVPLYRKDVQQQADLEEEIARIYGYDRIPSVQPPVVSGLSGLTAWQCVLEIKNLLSGQGFNETVTYSLVDRRSLEFPAEKPGEAIEILNPLSREQEVLRTSVMPGLLRCLAYNLNQKQEELRLFEIADIYYRTASAARNEERVLALAVCGTRRYFNGETFREDSLGPLHIKGVLEMLFAWAGLRDCSFRQHSVGMDISVYAGKERLGEIIIPNKKQAAAADIKNRIVVLAEIKLEPVLRARLSLQKKFRKLPLYPAIIRDISLSLREEIPLREIFTVAVQSGGVLLKEVKLTDIYKGEQISPGHKGLTVSCVYRSEEKTLTEEEIAPVHAGIVDALSVRPGVSLR